METGQYSRIVIAALALCITSLAWAEPKAEAEPAATLQVSDSQTVADPVPVCMPEGDDDKPALRNDCITVLEDVAKRKGRYAATTRHKRELRSLCENQWLPRCRHKY